MKGRARSSGSSSRGTCLATDARRALSVPALVAVLAFPTTLVACASTPPRDSVPDGQVEKVGVEGAPEGYEHMAQRRSATVALAESRGLDRAEITAAVETLADRLESCAREPSAGRPGPSGGVARIAARVADDGSVEGLNVKVDPAQASTALRCLVVPMKLLVFRVSPKAQFAGTRGFAIEAKWL